ncbi:MAG: RidA family protein [Desulfobacteraceae bacterium]|jgi:2-iminobutanoate/2-iminopropanoate deaminase
MMKRIITTVLLIFILTICSHQYAFSGSDIISSPDAPASIGPYSQAVRIGDMLFLSGQLGLDPATGKLAGRGFEVQARRALENQRAILEAAGFSLKDVVQCQIFMTDMNNYSTFNAIYKEYFNKNFPARVVLEVSRIPADGLVEIMMVAVRSK